MRTTHRAAREVPVSRPRRSALALAALLASVLLLAACGDGGTGNSDAGGDTGPGGEPITLIATEFEFEPDTLSVTAGTTSVTLDNEGVIEHDFVVDELGIHIHTEPGEEVTEDVTFESGTYDFYCSIPGHRESGMEGTLIVD